MNKIITLIVAIVTVLPIFAVAAPDAPESHTPQLAVPDNRPLGRMTLDKNSTLLANYSFDSGSSPDPQGWTIHDHTENARKFSHVDNYLPALAGAKSLWCGAVIDPTDPETAEWYYSGYGDHWRQEWVSRQFVAPNNDPMHLTYTTSWALIGGGDFIEVQYRVNGGPWQLARSYSTDGGIETHTFAVPLSAGSDIQYRFRFESNYSDSNADGGLSTVGAFLLDDLEVRNGTGIILSAEDFESEPIGATETLSGDWSAQVEPGFGVYAALNAGDQVRQDDAATYNDSNFWTFFNGSPDLYDCSGPQASIPNGGNSYQTLLDNEIRSPWLPLDTGANPRSFKVAFDAYLDSDWSMEPSDDSSAFYRVFVIFRDAAGNILGTRSTPYWYGLIQNWSPYHHQFNLPVGVAEVQVRFKVQALYESTCRRHAPMIDNVQISQSPAYTVTSVFNSGPNTLHWAITEANANPGPDRIDFDLAFSQPLNVSAPLPPITEQLHIAGFTTSGAQPNTLVGASDAKPGFELARNYAGTEPGLDIQADGCVIEGLAIWDFTKGIQIESSQNTVRGCWLGISADGEVSPAIIANSIVVKGVGGGVPAVGNTIGGPLPADQNVICNVLAYGIHARDNQQLLIQGNLVGLLPDGQTAASTHTGIAMLYCEDTELLDNVIAGCNYNSASRGISINFGARHTIRGNIVGLSGDQSQAVPITGTGISISGSSGYSNIGGCGPGEGNVIAGILGHGVDLEGDGPLNMRGNFIGTDATGTRTDLGNGGVGVLMRFANPPALFIGSGSCGNTIAYNGGAGIKAEATMTGWLGIRGNNIHHNGGLEIDLTEYTGIQEAVPIITQAELVADSLTVSGTASGFPDVELSIDIFVSRDCDDPSDPQAELYIGTSFIQLDSSGLASFTVMATGAFLPGDVVTGIAVGEDPTTSVIGACFTPINTPQGTAVEVILPDATAASYPVTVVFDNVTTAGITSAHLGSDSSGPPAEDLVFKVFTIQTTAAVTPGLSVCYDFADLGIHPSAEPHLELLQLDLSVIDGPWLPITTSIDQLNDRICGQTNELGPEAWGCFAIVYPNGASGVLTASTALRLLPNVPNPFNPSTQIRFELPQDSAHVTVDVYDLAGRHVRRLLAGPASAGPQTLNWNGKDDAGRQVVSGVYPLRLVNGRDVRLQRLVLLK